MKVRTLVSRFRISLAVSLLVLLVGCRHVENRVLYKPQKLSLTWSQPAPDELSGLEFEDVWFNSLDGTRLHGWFVQPSPRFLINDPQQPAPEPVSPILFAHGRGGNISELKTSLLEFVRRYRHPVFVFDYRGYGKSQGRPSEDGLYQDTAAARNWLANKQQLAAGEIILMGRSLGGAMAIDLAAKDGAKALIVECTFTSIPDVVRHHTGDLLSGQRLHSGFRSAEKIGKYKGPIFISHGINDRAIPYEHGVRLAEAATGATRLEFVKHEGGHRTPGTDDYKQKLGQFLTSLR